MDNTLKVPCKGQPPRISAEARQVHALLEQMIAKVDRILEGIQDFNEKLDKATEESQRFVKELRAEIAPCLEDEDLHRSPTDLPTF